MRITSVVCASALVLSAAFASACSPRDSSSTPPAGSGAGTPPAGSTTTPSTAPSPAASAASR